MANLANLLATIAANVYTNHNNEVTAQMVKDAMGAIVSTMGQSGYIYKGVATTSTNPSSPDANVFYIATAAGTYTNFGGIVVNAGEVAILRGTGTSWSKDVTGAATSAKLTELEQKVDDIVYDGREYDYLSPFLHLFSRGWMSTTGTYLGGAAYNYVLPLDNVKTIWARMEVTQAVQNNRVPCWLLDASMAYLSTPVFTSESANFHIVEIDTDAISPNAKYVLFSTITQSVLDVKITRKTNVDELVNDVNFYTPSAEIIQESQVVLKDGTSTGSSNNNVARYRIPAGTKRIDISATIGSASTNELLLFAAYDADGNVVAKSQFFKVSSGTTSIAEICTNLTGAIYLCVTYGKSYANDLSVKFYPSGNVPIYRTDAPSLPQVAGFAYNETAVDTFRRMMNSCQMAADMANPSHSFQNLADFTIADDATYYYLVGVRGRADIYGATAQSTHGYVVVRRINKSSGVEDEYIVANDSKSYTIDGVTYTTPYGASMANAILLGTNLHILFSTYVPGVGYTYMHCIFDTLSATISNYAICKIGAEFITPNLLFSLGYHIKDKGVNPVSGSTLNMNALFKDAHTTSGGTTTYYLGLCCHTDMPYPLILSTTDFVTFTIFKELKVLGMDACYECSTAVLNGYLFAATRQNEEYIVISKINISTGEIVGNYIVPGEPSRPALFVYDNAVYMIYNYASANLGQGASERKRLAIANLCSWFSMVVQDFVDAAHGTNISYPSVITTANGITIALQTGGDSWICEDVEIAHYSLGDAYAKMVSILV